MDKKLNVISLTIFLLYFASESYAGYLEAIALLYSGRPVVGFNVSNGDQVKQLANIAFCQVGHCPEVFDKEILDSFFCELQIDIDDSDSRYHGAALHMYSMSPPHPGRPLNAGERGDWARKAYDVFFDGGFDRIENEDDPDILYHAGTVLCNSPSSREADQTRGKRYLKKAIEKQTNKKKSVKRSLRLGELFEALGKPKESHRNFSEALTLTDNCCRQLPSVNIDLNDLYPYPQKSQKELKSIESSVNSKMDLVDARGCFNPFEYRFFAGKVLGIHRSRTATSNTRWQRDLLEDFVNKTLTAASSYDPLALFMVGKKIQEETDSTEVVKCQVPDD